MKNWICFFGHDYKKIASWIREIKYYKDVNVENTYRYSLTGNMNFVICRKCGYRDVTTELNSGSIFDKKEFQDSILINSKVATPIALNWKNGNDNPFPKEMIIEGLTVYDTSYFSSDAVNTFAINIHKLLNENHKEIMEREEIIDALQQVEDSLLNLRKVINIEKNKKNF